MSWYNKINKEARGNSPVMDYPFQGDPYIRSKPGDQNSDKPVSNRATHGLGDSGYGGHRFTKNRNPGNLGIFDDSDEDTKGEFGSAHDGGDAGGSNVDTMKPKMENGWSWYSEDSPLSLSRQMITNINSDNPDRHPRMLSNMNDSISNDVFDEFRKRRQK